MIPREVHGDGTGLRPSQAVQSAGQGQRDHGMCHRHACSVAQTGTTGSGNNSSSWARRQISQMNLLAASSRTALFPAGWCKVTQLHKELILSMCSQTPRCMGWGKNVWESVGAVSVHIMRNLQVGFYSHAAFKPHILLYQSAQFKRAPWKIFMENSCTALLLCGDMCLHCGDEVEVQLCTKAKENPT